MIKTEDVVERHNETARFVVIFEGCDLREIENIFDGLALDIVGEFKD